MNFLKILHKVANRWIKMVLKVLFSKIIVWGKWKILDPKIVHPHNSESSLNFCTMKRANR